MAFEPDSEAMLMYSEPMPDSEALPTRRFTESTAKAPPTPRRQWLSQKNVQASYRDPTTM